MNQALDHALKSAAGGASAVLLNRFALQPLIGSRLGLPEDLSKIAIGAVGMSLVRQPLLKSAFGALAVLGGAEALSRIQLGQAPPASSASDPSII